MLLKGNPLSVFNGLLGELHFIILAVLGGDPKFKTT